MFGEHEMKPAPAGGLDELLNATFTHAANNVEYLPGAEEINIAADILTMDDLWEMPDPTPLIDGIINHGNLVVISGNPGSGKTFWVLDLIATLATGGTWLGKETHLDGKEIMYMAGEGVTTLKPRLQSWAKHNGKTKDDMAALKVYRKALKLDDRDHARAVARYVQEKNVGVLVIDTLARAMANGDENSTQDMNTMIRHADMIREAMGSNGVVIFVHHNNKAGIMRGSSVLMGAVDVAYKVEKENDLMTISCDKRKDGELGDDIHLKLDTWGDSPVLVDATNIDHEEGNRLVTRMEGITASLPATGSRLQAMTGLGDVEFPRLLQTAIDQGHVITEQHRSNTVYNLA